MFKIAVIGAGQVGACIGYTLALTGCAGEIDPIQLERMIKSHGAEKILFASDCPWSDPRREKVMIEALDLRQREKDAIFSQNILRLLDL